MLKKTLSWAAALAMLTGATAANAADVTPLPRDWSGFYTGLHIGGATAVDSSLSSGSSLSQTTDAYCASNPEVTNPDRCETVTAEVLPAESKCVDQNGKDVNIPANKDPQTFCAQKNKNWVSLPERCSVAGVPLSDCSGLIGWVPAGTELIKSLAKATSDDNLKFLAGINAGYNFQAGSVVMGVEADISNVFNDKKDLSTNTTAASTLNSSYMSTSAQGEFGLSNVGTLRARLGYDIDGKWLPFLTGGLAWGRVDTEGTASYLGYDSGTDEFVSKTNHFGDNKYEMGWTAGAGVDYRVADNAFIGLTYLYTDLGSHSVHDAASYTDTNGNTWAGSVDGKVDAKFHQVRLSFDVMW